MRGMGGKKGRPSRKLGKSHKIKQFYKKVSELGYQSREAEISVGGRQGDCVVAGFRRRPTEEG